MGLFDRFINRNRTLIHAGSVVENSKLTGIGSDLDSKVSIQEVEEQVINKAKENGARRGTIGQLRQHLDKLSEVGLSVGDIRSSDESDLSQINGIGRQGAKNIKTVFKR